MVRMKERKIFGPMIEAKKETTNVVADQQITLLELRTIGGPMMNKNIYIEELR